MNTKAPEPPSSVDKFNLDKAIEHIAHWLPTQGPIKDFIHHNTLHSVQHYPFHQGVAVAAKVFGARSYLPLDDYKSLYNKGRITPAALEWAVARSGLIGKAQDGLTSRLFVKDTHSHYPPLSIANNGIRNALLNHLEIDLNAQVHPVIFRLLGNYLDQGISRWTMPKDGERFWDCILRLVHNSFLPLYPFHDSYIRELLLETPDQVIATCLDKIVGDEALYEQYLLEILLAHPGWSGMVSMIEQAPQILLVPRLISLKELIAVELACELAFLHKKKGEGFQNIAQLPALASIPRLESVANSAKVSVRLKVWHEAMEWALHTELLTAIKTQQKPPESDATSAMKIQAFFCIDDRECSIRRHLETVNPNIETFGAAGFFGIDFLYQGLDDAYPVAQCPVVITPNHLVMESGKPPKPKDSDFTNMHFTSHSLFRGWLFTQTLGIGYAIRLAWNVFRPSSQLPKIKTLSEVPAHSKLHLLRESDTPTKDGYLLGFSFTEMADRVGGLLTNIGLTDNFAALVVIVAHGSSSVNNPHFAAYDCGACSGKPGSPNARAFAWMANHESVRKILRERGIDIPTNTRFIAALHNTSRDEVTYFDAQLHETFAFKELDAFKATMTQALELNAKERCRWFELAPKALKKSHQHVRARASSIFEPRPEYNHSNNLYCVVGKRELTKNLFLDRRAFLHSYAAETDATGAILVKILGAIIPVCGGINLEYLFSRIDNSVYGAGTKLPHNVIGLLGVANGVEGDLRTGLPQQMIEVHEPARLLIVIEQTPEIIDKALAKIGALKEWLDNDWVRVVACRPIDRELSLYSLSGWQDIDLPTEASTPLFTRPEHLFDIQNQTIPAQQLTRSAS
ncbi:YbcC family protein [Crenothrix sp.]|uniref:YbcC family protein n=1 Tax=Crenothrix sp. TaxID=3100433 RepID=UPI00374D5FA8